MHTNATATNSAVIAMLKARWTGDAVECRVRGIMGNYIIKAPH